MFSRCKVYEEKAVTQTRLMQQQQQQMLLKVIELIFEGFFSVFLIGTPRRRLHVVTVDATKAEWNPHCSSLSTKMYFPSQENLTLEWRKFCIDNMHVETFSKFTYHTYGDLCTDIIRRGCLNNIISSQSRQAKQRNYMPPQHNSDQLNSHPNINGNNAGVLNKTYRQSCPP